MRILQTPGSKRVDAQLASQPRFGELAVGIMRALADDDGARFAVLRLAGPGVDERVRLDVGGSHEVPGHGRLTLEGVLPSTPQRRGWVRLLFEPLS